MTTETIELEIVPADSGLELAAKTSLEQSFSGFFQQAQKWKEQASTITDPKLARTARLELKNIRVAAEKKRKELKEDSLRMGKAIDGANNILLALIVPIEKRLEDIEKEEERKAAAAKAQLIEDRLAALAPFIDASMPPPAVGELTEDQFSTLLADSKTLFEAKKAAAEKAEQERIAKEKAEAEERARIAAENERLKKEAEEREKAIAAEREAAEKARIEAEAKAKAERERIEAEARKEREKAEAAAKAEKERLEAIAAEERRKAQEAADIAANKQKEADAAKAKAEAEAQALREAEEKRKADEAAEAERQANAPDKERLIQFASNIRTRLNVGELKSAKGQAIAQEIADQVEKFAAWIEKKAASL